MKESDEGTFYLSNGIGINKDIDKDRLADVVTHEFTHSMLYTKSTFGQLVMMLEKNSLMDEQSGIISQRLVSYLHRMQEQSAVNIERLSKLANGDVEDYIAGIESLKLRNNIYFNHFRKLCCINGRVSSKEDAKVAINVIDVLARYALNVDINAIPFDTFKTDFQVKRFFENDQNVAKYSPNKRFDILVNVLFRRNNTTNDLKSVVEGSFHLEDLDDLDAIHEQAMKCLEKIYKDNPLKSRLLRRAESVGSMRLEMYEGIETLLSRPMHSHDSNDSKIRVIRTESEFVESYKKNHMNYYCVFKSLRGLEDFHTVVFFTYEGDKKVTNAYYFWDESNDELFKLMGQLEGTVIFYNINFMLEAGKYIKKMVTRLPIYIFIDVPIGGMLDQINKIAKAGKFTLIPAKNKKILAIDNDRSIIIFTDVLDNADEVVRREFAKRNLKECTPEEFEHRDDVVNYDTVCNEFEDDTPISELNLKKRVIS